MPGDLYITGDAAADALLNDDFDALMIGMLLDQQVPLEWAFKGPFTLRARLGHLEPETIAALDEDEFVTVCCEKPAIHRFPASMGKRIRSLCAALTDEWDGHAASLWADGCDAATLSKRLRALPGFGPEKTKIFIALLAKRFAVRPDGWERAAGVFSDDEPRTIADCADEASLAAVRAWKAAQKAAGKDKQGRPTSA
ncbi:MAG: HhH-GPD-type base excision DNA repair protein [Ilumatobacter fluminis]|uniref:Putative HhH-GPD family protein n=1 Tax=Ilumatobacter fluminis TaxID=467091 RepID=A0A4R7I251_9ACTN|nr:HhH-GPD-type base excision DNA repair protein [Ilumatobacter fluminis]TDT17280.1 putative HhH-GPD family protein [Ilumatobacter fluminis]